MSTFQHNIILNDTFLAFIDGNKCIEKKDFFKEIALALNFPAYFGSNLDALAECITDLEWIEEKKIHLFILNSTAFLEKDKDILADVNSIFFNAISELAEYKVSFAVHWQDLK